MNHNDLPRFAEVLADMIGVLSHGKVQPDERAIAMWFRVLEPYTLAQVTTGMTAHMRSPTTGRTLPIPSDIVAQIVGASEQDGRPDADEAWAIAAEAASEAATVVWTREIAEAWGQVLPLVSQGDMVAARKSFQSIYSRLVSQARSSGRRLQWEACLGHDKARQADAIRLAAQRGRIAGGPAADVLQLEALPPPDRAWPLLSVVAEGDSLEKAFAIASLESLRQAIAEKDDIDGIVDDSERRRTNELKARAARLAADAGLH